MTRSLLPYIHTPNSKPSVLHYQPQRGNGYFYPSSASLSSGCCHHTRGAEGQACAGRHRGCPCMECAGKQGGHAWGTRGSRVGTRGVSGAHEAPSHGRKLPHGRGLPLRALSTPASGQSPSPAGLTRVVGKKKKTTTSDGL